MEPAINSKPSRLLSLDILRGMTIAFMIIVNNPGSWSYMYAPLEHAEWNGVTPTDFIFPFFMFCMGVSMCFSLKKFNYEFSSNAFLKVLKRGLGIYLIGVLIILYGQTLRWNYHFDDIRLTGVLARLAICYVIAALIVLTAKPKWIIYIIAIILVLYGVLLVVGNGFEQTADNVLSQVDTAVLGPHMYRFNPESDYNLDPEGVLSTIPGVAHVLIGFLVGKLLLKPVDIHEKIEKMMLFGVAAIVLAYWFQYGCPLNKKVWSSTFVLMTCGAASAMLGFLTWLIDVKGCKKWTKFFNVVGMNSLFCFVLAGVFSITFSAVKLPIEREDGGLYNIHSTITHFVLKPLFGGEELSSFVYSLIMLALVWTVALILYKKKIYVKL